MELGRRPLFAGVAVIVVTPILHSWNQSNREVNEDVGAYVEALGGTADDPGDFDSTPYYVLGGGSAALLILSGVILYATNSNADDPDS